MEHPEVLKTRRKAEEVVFTILECTAWNLERRKVELAQLKAELDQLKAP